MLTGVRCACETSVIEAGTPPGNLEAYFTCHSLCLFGSIIPIIVWTEGFETITQEQGSKDPRWVLSFAMNALGCLTRGTSVPASGFGVLPLGLQALCRAGAAFMCETV